MDLVQKSLSVDFHQDKLTLVEYNGQPYVAMKPLVENMGLDWRSQQRKLTAKRWGMVKMTIPTNGDLQEMLCLPLRKLSSIALYPPPEVGGFTATTDKPN